MATISIEGGCTERYDGDWEYEYTDNAGIHLVIFSASQKPKIGDSIVNGVLVPLVGYKSNQDHSKWITYPDTTWP